MSILTSLARLVGLGRPALGVTEEDPATPVDEQRSARIEPPPAPEALSEESVVAALRTVHDPEIPVNIYDLGLIYRIETAENGDVGIDMTLTAPACPVAGAMPKMVEEAVGAVPGVGAVHVELVWDPPWTQDKMTDEARLQLGMM
jgi:FeS assembly SUF system protein